MTADAKAKIIRLSDMKRVNARMANTVTPPFQRSRGQKRKLIPNILIL
jgi:hypothetical protein